MSRAAHPRAMTPSRGAGRTRTAPPQMPPQFPFAGRYRSYVLFGATGLVYLLLGFGVLRAIWALGSGARPWARLMDSYQDPAYLAFHVFGLVCVIFVGGRFYSLFPKAQPPRLGPLPRPPRGLIYAMLYVAWAVVSGGLALVIGGVYPL